MRTLINFLLVAQKLTTSRGKIFISNCNTGNYHSAATVIICRIIGTQHLQIYWASKGSKELDIKRKSTTTKNSNSRKSRPIFTWLLNILIVILAVFVVYFSYAFISRQIPTESKEPPSLVIDTTHQVIQIEILNGCGIKGTASKFRLFLMSHGFDVVDVRNYKSFDIQETLVIDRIGNLSNADGVAKSLGVSKKNVIQQINPDYFVAVSVIIGKDYNQLKPMI